MLKLDEANLLHEINNASEYAARFLDAYERNRRAMPGPSFVDRGDGKEYAPINVVHEWMSRVRPRISFRDPWWRMKSRRSGQFQQVAYALSSAMNTWTQWTAMHKLNRKLCADFGLAWFVARVQPRAADSELWAEFDDPVMLPFVERISPSRFFWDPMALNPEECRFYGHFWVRDLEDLQREAEEADDGSWNVKAVNDLTPGSGREFIKQHDNEFEVDRQEIVGCSLWIPEARPDSEFGPDDGFNGAIVDLAMQAKGAEGEPGSEGRIIRPLRAFYGPRWGPYVWCGSDIVPDETAFLSPITAAATQIDDLNGIAKREITNAKGYRRLVFVNDAKEDLSDIVRDEPDRSVIPTAGVKKEDIAEIEVLGNTQQGMAQLMWSRKLVDDALGMDDAQRGTVGGQGTATEVAEAAQNSNARVDDMAFAFAAGIEQIGRTVSWYLYHDDRVVLPLDNAVAQEIGMEAPWYFGGDDRKPEVRRRLAARLRAMNIVPPEELALWGGDPAPGSGASFDDLELSIDIKSMNRVDPRIRAQEVIGGLGFLAQAAQLGPTAPWIDWEGALEQAGDIYNMPELSDLWDEQMFAQMVAQGMQAQRGPRQFSTLLSIAGKAGAGGAASGGTQKPAEPQFGGGRGGASAKPGGRQSGGAQAMRMQPGATPNRGGK